MNRTVFGMAITGAAAAVSLIGVAPALAGTHPGKTRPVATTLTVKATSKQGARSGHAVKATVVGTLRARHKPVAGESIALYERKGSGKAWTATDTTATTGADGTASFTFTQTAVNEQYQLRFAGDPATTPPLKKSHSGTISVHRARASSTSS